MAHVVIRSKDCDTVDELWSVLDPMRPLTDGPNNFVYRGQRRSKWCLVPSALRPFGARKRTPVQLISKRDGLTADEHAFAELRLLRLFVEACDLSGLALPLDSPSIRSRWMHDNPQGFDSIAKNPVNWPPDELFGFLALAQHHGVPTRLLDWTRRSFVAAYFAAADAIRNEEALLPTRRLAVWALDLERRALFPDVEVVRVPGATSQNLAPQQALFTLVRQQVGRGSPFENRNIEDVMNGTFAHDPMACPLWKITLPHSEAPVLLDRCGKFAVSGATLFPGYDGSARGALERLIA